MPACFPLQLLCSCVGCSPRAASAAAAGSYDGRVRSAGEIVDARADPGQHRRDQLDVPGLAVVRGAHDRQLALAETEPFEHPGPDGGSGDERLGRGAQENGRVDRSDP